MSLQHVNGHYVVDQGAAAFLPASLRVLRNAGTDAGVPRGPRLGRMALHVLVLGCFGSCLVLSAAVQSPKVPVVAKWGRFEQSFTSGIAYSNALQEATLKVVFTSPLGQTNQVDGFWDGGKIWRVRFSPDQPGRWTFRTTCSDGSNTGLHNKTGELVCTAATGKSRFNRHGPVRIARDHRHFEHADGTAFFWVADTVWNGARISDSKSWEFYTGTRMAQKFTVAAWAVAPGSDSKKDSAFRGPPNRIMINPDFFKRLDGKVELLEPLDLIEGTRLLVTVLADEEQTFWTAASQPSLDAVWNNPEDDVYAELLKE